MKLSSKGLDLIKGFESYLMPAGQLYAYLHATPLLIL